MIKSIAVCIFALCSMFIFSLSAFAKDTLLVSIAPQAYFLKRIVGSTAHVITLLPNNADPHTFEFSSSILRTISNAKLFFTIGVGLENQWEQRILTVAPKIRIVPSYIEMPTPYMIRKDNTTAHTPQTLEYIHERDSHNHPHNNGSCTPVFKEHPNGVMVPVNQHVWTSPRAMRVVVEQMLITLLDIYPQHKELYTKNANQLLEKINAIDSDIQKALEKKQYKTFISYHPSWSYFANEYKLQELVIEENEREPSAKAIALLVKKAKQHKAPVILTQPQFSQKSVKTVSKELGNLPIVAIDPLQENWFDTMNDIKNYLVRYLQ